MFERLLNLFGKKKHPSPKANASNVKAERLEVKERILVDLQHLKNSIKRDNVREKSRQFLIMVKARYAQALSLQYEATFQEITREMGKCKRIPPALRDEMGRFLEELTYMDYDWEECSEVLQTPLSSVRAPVGKDAQKHVPEAHQAPRKRLEDIARAKSLSSERALLLHSIGRFEGYLPHLF